MKPYYEQDGVTIYHGDCRDVLPKLPKFDLLLTDPPYGIARVWTGGTKHGWSNAAAETHDRNQWDHEPVDAKTLGLALSLASNAVIWGGNYFPLPLSRGWLVWNKPERNFTLAEAELAWTTKDAVIRVKDLPRSESLRQHPTQKPEALMRWCLQQFPDAWTVLDPFMGSGTTLVAAKRLGKSAVGIEAQERYCEIAAERLRQGALDLFGEATA